NKFIFFSLVCVCVCMFPTNPPSVSRVVGGEDVKANSWPWQVLEYIFYYTRPGHCMARGPQLCFTVAACTAELGEQRLALLSYMEASFFSPPGFVRVCFSNDIALIKLQTPVQFSDTISPACLPPSGQVLPNNYPCYVTGWGRLWTGGPLADNLQQALLPVVDHATCTKPDWWGNLVTTQMVCAGGDGQLASCNGDSGGPLNCQRADGTWDVDGIVSFGSSLGCNYPKKPSVFTRVASYIDWINKMVCNDGAIGNILVSQTYCDLI
uniref:pancreatic elastase II n=1 Tax=Astyanax mexicanus TaxID=7994 RepID=A0A8B9LAK7_ASTMX